MLAWIYEVAARTNPALAPSFLIGGVAENFGTSFRVAATRPFILEGDEYDTAFFDKGPKFLHYFPDSAILTHVEFDHADIYADLAAVKTAFKRLVNLIPQRGRLIAFDGSENVTECVAKALCNVERYGFAPTSYWQLRNLRHEGGTSHWQLHRAGEPLADLTLPLAGEHNALNASAAAALAAGQGIAASAIEEAIRTFRSVKRRLEIRVEINGITVIDDFAHHPTAIRENTSRPARKLSQPPPLGHPRTSLQHPPPQRSSSSPWSTPSHSPTASSSPVSSGARTSPPPIVSRPRTSSPNCSFATSTPAPCPTPTPSSPASFRNLPPVTSSPSSRTAASATSTKSSPVLFRQASNTKLVFAGVRP